MCATGIPNAEFFLFCTGGFVTCKALAYYSNLTEYLREVTVSIRIFEGARRLALTGAFIAICAVLVDAATYQPYTVKLNHSYKLSLKNEFEKTQDVCPEEGKKSILDVKTSKNTDAQIVFCIFPKPLNYEDIYNQRQNIQKNPTEQDEECLQECQELLERFDEWKYNKNVSTFSESLVHNFQLSESDELFIDKEHSTLYWENFIEAVGYLLVGLIVYAGVVWTIGWIVRGFMGIPIGQDQKP